jgi:hypothetical protein
MSNWKSTKVVTIDGDNTTVCVGNCCVECDKITEAFPMNTFHELVDAKEVPAIKKGIKRASEIIRSGKQIGNGTVDKHNGFDLLVGRHVELLNESELMSAAKRQSLPISKIENIPMLTVPDEKEPGKYEKVYVFPDTSKPHRCGILQHRVGIDMGTNLMNPQQQLFEEQAANIFAWGLQSTYTGYGMHELHEKKQHHWQTLPTILKRINPKLFEPSDAEHSGAEGNEGENENGDGDADVDDIFAETGGVNQAQLALQAPEVSGNVRRPKNNLTAGVHPQSTCPVRRLRSSCLRLPTERWTPLASMMGALRLSVPLPPRLSLTLHLSQTSKWFCSRMNMVYID